MRSREGVSQVHKPNNCRSEQPSDGTLASRLAATEATVLGPFHTEDADVVPVGSNIVSEKSAGEAQPLIVRGFVRDTAGTPIPNATIETWEVDHTGHYDTQYADRTAPDCRGILKSRDNGEVRGLHEPKALTTRIG